MTKLLSFLSLLAVATGCGDCEPVSLTPGERAWVSAYQPGQRLTFRSSRGAANVLTVQLLKEFHYNQDCNQLESGKYQVIRSTLALTSATAYSSASPAFRYWPTKPTPTIRPCSPSPWPTCCARPPSRPAAPIPGW